jgi:carbon-monoxide dehydrogenase medium subunit
MTCYVPKNISELFDALGKITAESKIIGDGTDLIIRLNKGDFVPDALLYIGEVEGTRNISETADSIEIGSSVNMTDIAESPLLTEPYAALKQAAASVGAVQIRNMATIGGNFANASPAGDLIPALYLLSAKAVIAGADGSLRCESADSLILGPGKTSLKYNDAIVRFVIPKTGALAKSAYVKLGYRKALTVSRIGLCMALDFDSNGVVSFARVIAGAISLKPVSVKKAEQYLTGRKLGPETAGQVGKLLSDLIMDITPEMFDRDYKAHAAFGVAEDLFKTLIEESHDDAFCAALAERHRRNNPHFDEKDFTPIEEIAVKWGVDLK